MPVYSVKKPPVSSCSASTRSNGGWLVSATAATRKITKGTNDGIQYHFVTKDPAPFHACCATTERVDSVFAWTSTPSTASPNAASYERSWAEARTDPSSGYFEPD